MNRIFTAFFLSATLFLFCTSFIEKGKKDARFEGITLTTLGGASFTFNEVKGKPVAIFFLAPECPLSQNYTLNINRLYEEYSKKGFYFLCVVPGTHDSRMDLVSFRHKYQLRPELLIDEEYELTHQLRASVTPEVVLMDAAGEVVYQGAIDNWAYDLTKTRQVVTEHYLKDALEALQKGHPVMEPRTKPIGCFITMITDAP